MSNILLCIEVHNDKLLAVKLAAGPYVNLVIGSADIKTKMRPLDKVVARLKEEVGFDEGRVHLLFAPECCLFRNLKVPFADRKKIEQVLPMELIESLPVEIDDLITDFIVTKTDSEGAKIVAGLLPKELLSNVLGALTAEGMKPESVGVGGISTCLNIVDTDVKNFVMLDVQANGVGVYAFSDGCVSLVRSVAIDVPTEGVEQILKEVQRTLLASGNSWRLSSENSIFVSGLPSLRDATVKSLREEFEGVDVQVYCQSEQPLTKINAVIRDKYFPGVMDGLLAKTVRGGENKGNFNYLKGEFKQKTSGREYRRYFMKFAIPALAALVVIVGFQIYDYKRLVSEKESLDKQIVSVFKETMPSATRIVNPVKELQIANNEIRSTYGSGGEQGGDGSSMIELLAEISALIPESYQVRLIRLVADLETMRLRGLTADFNTVDSIQKELEKSELFTEVGINSANQSPQNDEVRFELKLLLAR